MPPKGSGIRSRFGLLGRASHAPASDDAAPASGNQPPVLRQGIRRRMGLVPEAAVAPENPPPSHPSARPGIRRRYNTDAAASSASQGEETVHLPLNVNMKKSFASGELSAKKIESIFRDAASQGAHGTPTLSSPNYPQNLQRSLVAAFGTPAGAPEIEWRLIPTALGIIPHPFLLPHKFLASLFTSKPTFWTKTVSGPLGAARRFWENMETSSFVREHPGLDGLNRDKLIPLGLDGDSGKFSYYESLFVFTFNSCLGEGPTRSTRFLMTAIKKSLLAPGTIDAVAKMFGWSFNVCLTGSEAATDENGNPLPISGTPRQLFGGFKGVLVRVRGGWEFYNSVFMVPHWKNLDRMCWLCCAVGDPNHRLKYSRTDERAPWRRTRQSHAAFLR